MRLRFPVDGLSSAEIEKALLRAAAGDHGAEAGVVLLVSYGGWILQLGEAGLITIDICVDCCCDDGPTAQINWGEVEAALAHGLLTGTLSDVGVLRMAASLADGRPVVRRDLAAGLDRRAVGPIQAAIAFATYDPAIRHCISGGP